MVAHAGADGGALASSSVLPPWEGTAILLVDLDAFFASVEQLDHPGWRGKPVIVGGDADARGVVSTASYEARAFGVHSAMPSSQAARLCPEAIWTRGHFSRYRQMSDAVMGILRSESPRVQQVSIDEAFLDVTPTPHAREHPVEIARRIQARVDELGVSCSVGVGATKTVAKIASEQGKPHGLTAVYPGEERAFLGPLPVRALSGVGAAAEERLRSRGIFTLGELAMASPRMLERLLGKNGLVMRVRARGEDVSRVEEGEGAKSVSNEVSFAHDLSARQDVEAAVASVAAKVARRLRKKGLFTRCVVLKLRFADRSVHTAQRQLENPTDDGSVIASQLMPLLGGLWREGIPVRLVGASATGLSGELAVQGRLFEVGGEEAADAAPGPSGGQARAQVADERRRRLMEATDSVRDRFGEGAVSFGRELRNRDNTTGSAAKNPADYR